MILLAGATGLVGRAVARHAPEQALHLIGRRAVDGAAAQSVAPVEGWPEEIATLKPDVAISTLGTTIKQAGSKAAFRAVDHDLVVSYARAAKDSGARQFIMVSSVGASATASNFYLKTKGEAEASVRALGFDRVDIMRPGLLRGKRGGEARPGERVAMALSPITDALTPHVLSQYRSIAAEDVALAILALTGASEDGAQIHHHAEMLALAGQMR
jgi:uncharacterized protein YbjT (DUF2867 family)